MSQPPVLDHRYSGHLNAVDTLVIGVCVCVKESKCVSVSLCVLCVCVSVCVCDHICTISPGA